MKEYYVRSLPIGRVIADLAVEMQTHYYNECSFYKVNIPKKIGTGSISGIQFESGFALLNYDCKFYKKTQIKFTYDMVHPIKFIHCYSGYLEHNFEDDSKTHQISTYQNIVVASKHNGGHVLNFDSNEHIKVCSVEIDRLNFFKKIGCYLKNEEGPIVNAIKDTDALYKYYKRGKYNIAITNIISKLVNFDALTLGQLLLKEGLSYTLLSYQWMEFKTPNGQVILRKHEYELFMEIKEYIQQNISRSLTIEELSRIFFISNKRLQKLFKVITKKTVKKFIQDYRLEMSLDLLVDPENNISDVVYKLGLTNRSYFSRTFKEKYGLSPKKYISKKAVIY